MKFGRKNNDYDVFNSEKIDNVKSSKKFRLPKFFKKNRILKSISSFFSNKNVLKKIGVTITIIIIYRLLTSIPLPGVDLTVYKEVFGQSSASETSFLFTLFTGGNLSSPSIVGLGLVAYINASIIMQLLPMVIKRLEELQKEGERGRQIINQITRYLTFPLSFVYSLGYLLLLSRQDISQTITTLPQGSFLIPRADGSEFPSILTIIFMSLILSAGTVFLMWLSEIITEKGLGNGASVIISVGILAGLPAFIERDLTNINVEQIIRDLAVGSTTALTNPLTLSFFGVILGFFVLIGLIIFINEAQRKIPIQYARRVRAGEGGQGSFLPIKFTLTGVMPVIFAFSLLTIPQFLVPIIESSNGGVTSFSQSIRDSFLYASADQVINSKDAIYDLIYFFLVIFFGVFYAFIVFKPKDRSEELQKAGAFIPGIRPGNTTKDFISSVLLKMTIVGSIFLAFIALLPILVRNLVFENTGIYLQLLSGIGGTSILITVAVLLETMRQYKSFVATRSYERYLNN